MRNSCIAALVITASIGTTAAAIFGLAIASGIAVTAGEFEQLAGPITIANAGALRDRSDVNSADASGYPAAAGGTTAAV